MKYYTKECRIGQNIQHWLTFSGTVRLSMEQFHTLSLMFFFFFSHTQIMLRNDKQ